MFLPHKILEEKLRVMLAEDIGQGDVTTSLIVPADICAEASVVAKQLGIAAGIEEATVLLQGLGLKVEASVNDGKKVRPGEVLIRIFGDARTILATERILLNLLSRMSGIATATRNLVEKLRKAKVKTRVACTRKTAPGLLYFDKKAVLIGGGDTHRLHLDDMILIKDNHITLIGSVEKAVQKARKHASVSKKIEVEVTKVEEIVPAVKARADIIMLDNFSPKQIERATVLLKKENLYGKILLEASGGITSQNIIEFASTGVDFVSLGEITQSARALDVSLEINRRGKVDR
jgi:nicotinate-nucleotide pyrophosphorylase (carboxylating)